MEDWNRSTLVLAAGGHGKSHYYQNDKGSISKVYCTLMNDLVDK